MADEKINEVNFMKTGLVIFSFICFMSIQLTGCASVDSYLNDPFSVEKQACKKGDGKNCNLLGMLYYYGNDSTKQNFPKALKYYSVACNNNYASACNKVGLMYEAGEDVNKNIIQAKFHYAKGCKLKSVSACKNYKRLN